MKTTLIAAVVLYLSTYVTATAAQGVVESQAFTPGQLSAQSSQAAVPNNDALTLLLEQNQQLRTELQALRAMVEEQGFELRKMQRDSLNRYTNMDDRLSALESAAVAPRPANPGVASTPGVGTNPGITNNSGLSTSPIPTRPLTTPEPETAIGAVTTPRTGIGGSTRPIESRSTSRSRGTLQPAVLSEQQLYQMAYDSVINSNFERSIAEFDQYLSVYPEGRFLTNAHYWKGQAYLYLNRYNEARDSYEIILDDYPDSAKLPDAMYGLALAYQGLGNLAQARQLLNEIKRNYPNTAVANLADTRLLTLD